MANSLDFSVQLRLLNDNFNAGINQAKDKFGQLRQSVERNVAQMGADTERAAKLMGELGNVSPDKLTAEIARVSTALRNMGAGANLSGEQIDEAMRLSALQVTRLARELDVARSEAARLGDTPATPAQLAEAAAKVGNLTASAEAARLEVERLSRTNGTPEQIEAAKAKVDSLGESLTEARTKVTQMSQTRGTPEDIDSAKVKIDSLSSAVDDARLNVQQLSRTNGTPADIIEAKAKIDGVSNSLDVARLNVEQLSRTNGTPSDIAEAKAKIDLLGSSIDAAKLKVTELSRTVGTPSDIAEAKNRVNDLGLSVDTAKLKVRELSQTKGTPEDIESAKAKIISLKDELGAAKDSVKLLRDSKASPEDIEEAQNKVKGLTSYIKGTQDEVKRLRETRGTPEDIATAKSEFNNLKASVIEAKNQVKLLSETRGTPEDIAAAKGKVDELGQSLVSAKNEAKLLSQTNASPAEIADAKAKVDELKNTLGAAKDEAKLLSQTSASPAEIAEARARVAALSQDLSGARTESRQLNQTSGSPAELIEAKAKVNELKSSLASAKDEVKQLSQTNASPADIAEAKARVAALKSELSGATDEAKALGRTSGSPADLLQAKQQAEQLANQLNEARLEAERLNSTGASPAELAEAAARVNKLQQELEQARIASTTLSTELAAAMNRAASTADNARNAIYRMANVRVPETIRSEIDEISRALTEFQNNSGRPAAEIERVTRSAQEQIRRLEQELRGVDDTINRTETSTNNLGGGVNKLKGAFGNLQGILAAAGLGIGIAEIIETADAFKTLEARIKLATGAGAGFATAFEGVKQIANESFSSVQSTGELFARISASAESMSLSQQQILGVTKTINEAIKLSGGTAASADAAIVQLIQGLQSGVVRGEEFNSIMEQAPRLAKAMADGLGVTRGELRAMANAGQLTSEVVIGAVRDQGEAIATEFGTLPTTVGNALQVVKNQIFAFVGELDSSLNQTSKLASGIGYIGDSLESLDPSFVAALTNAFQNTIGVIATLATGIRDAYVMISDTVNAIAGGSTDAAEQVGLITRSLQGVSVVIGFIKDGFSAIGIAAEFVVASLYGAMSDLANIASSITFGDISDRYKAMANDFQGLSKETWDKAEQDVSKWESSGVKSFTDAAMTAKDRFADIASESEKTYNKMVADGTATADAIEGQLVKMVTDRIKANDNIISDMDRLLLAEKGLQASVDDTGEITIESAKKIQAAYLGVGESFAEVALKAQESGKSIELSLSEAIHNANTRDAVNDIVLSLKAMASQGIITGEQLALGQTIAKTQMGNVEVQIAKNMETFADYAADVIQKEGGITAANKQTILTQLEQVAALQNLGVQFSQTNGVIITELDKTTIASDRTKEQIDELAGAVGIGLSKEFVKANTGLNSVIDGFDDLTDAGYDAGHAVVMALTNMTDKAANTQEIDNVIALWQDLAAEGKITGQELADGLDLANERLDALTDGVNSVNEAYKLLGLTTREEAAKQAEAYTSAYGMIVKDGKATAGQLKDAFEKTAKAAIAANGDVISATIKNQAAQRGLTVAVDENGRVTFKSMSDAAEATRRVRPAIDGVSNAYNGLSSSASKAGSAMVNAANDARSAYDKLQDSIKAAKEAMAVAKGDETLKNLRIYGKEDVPKQGNQFGSRTAIESFAKSAGLDESDAKKIAEQIWSKRDSKGNIPWAAMQGLQDGQHLTIDQAANFKSPSQLILDMVEKIRYQKSSSSRKDSIDNNSSQKTIDDNPTQKIIINKNNASQYGEQWDDSKNTVFDKPSWLSPIPQSALESVGNLNKQADYNAGNNSSNVTTKSYDIKFTLGSLSANASVPVSQSQLFEELMQQLADSKAIAGY